MKTCSKCNVAREHIFYSKDPRNKDGLQSQCQICRKAAKTKVAEGRKGMQITVKSKRCNKCEVTKNATEFFKDSGIADGLATICKACKTEKALQWRANNREQYNATQRAYSANNYHKLRLNRYNLSYEEYQAMLISQANKCAICIKPAKGKRPLVIDHNHATDKVRQLLCYGCNRALHILENETLLQAAQEYLAKHK